MLSKLKSLRESELLPHYLGAAVGVAIALIFGGLISNEADEIEIVVPEEEVADGGNTELPE